MGTWGTGPFENDAAADVADALDRAEPEDRERIIRGALARGLTTSRFVEAEEAIGAAAAVAATHPNGKAVDTSGYGPTKRLSGCPPDLSSMAMRVLNRIIDDEPDWDTTWVDSADATRWITSLRRLRQVLTRPAHADLPLFAAALAARLPGQWTSEYRQHPTYPDQFATIERLWDRGHVEYIVHQHVLGHEAVLHGPDGQHLYVNDRPLRPGQFIVAPLSPDAKPHHFAGVEEPNGIAVPNDPVRAAAHIARRLLPRYELALRAVRRSVIDRPEHEPPHRKAPPQVNQTLTLTFYEDGALGTPYKDVPEEAREALYVHGFQYVPHQAAFLLPPSYGVADRAVRIQAVALRLAAAGIGVNLRHAKPTPSLPPRPPAVARPVPALPTAPAARAR